MRNGQRLRRGISRRKSRNGGGIDKKVGHQEDGMKQWLMDWQAKNTKGTAVTQDAFESCPTGATEGNLGQAQGVRRF